MKTSINFIIIASFLIIITSCNTNSGSVPLNESDFTTDTTNTNIENNESSPSDAGGMGMQYNGKIGFDLGGGLIMGTDGKVGLGFGF